MFFSPKSQAVCVFSQLNYPVRDSPDDLGVPMPYQSREAQGMGMEMFTHFARCKVGLLQLLGFPEKLGKNKTYKIVFRLKRLKKIRKGRIWHILSFLTVRAGCKKGQNIRGVEVSCIEMRKKMVKTFCEDWFCLDGSGHLGWGCFSTIRRYLI